MKKETLLTFSVVLLLLLNFGVLAYLFTGQKHGPGGPPHGHGPGDGPPVDRLIRNTLHFTPEQDDKFEALKHDHHSQMMTLDDQYENQLLQYFALLKNEKADSTQKQVLEKQLADIQVKKAAVTYQHFIDLRNLCTPEQKPGFDSILPQIMRVVSPGGPPHGPPPAR